MLCGQAFFSTSPAAAQTAQPAQPAQATQDITPQGGSNNLQVEDVVVSARHQEEKLQDVPIPITAVTSEDLDNLHDNSLRQIQQEVPSLLIQGFNPRNATLTIRGIGTNGGATNSGLEQGVGIYIDGVYYARPGITVVDMWDINSIEVLRGPQGTLYGKNTVAGVLNITTELPTFATQTILNASYGNYNFAQFRAAVSGRIADSDFAFRLSTYVTSRDGTIFDTVHDSNVQDLHTGGVKAQILYQPTDLFSFRVIADYNAQKNENINGIVSAILPTTLANGSIVNGYYQKAARFPFYTPVSANPSARITDSDSDNTIFVNTGGLSAQADAKIFGGNTLTSITAYRYWAWNPAIDGDLIGLPISTAGNLATRQSQVSQEFRLASPSGGVFNGLFDYSAGVYYFWQHNREHQDQTYGSAAGGWYINPINGVVAPPGTLNTLASLGDISSTTNSYSGFASATYHIVPNLNLTGGLRYTYEVRDGTYNSYQEDGIPLSSVPAIWQPSASALRTALAPTTAYSAETSNGAISGTVNLSYRFNDQLLGYTSYSRGFKGAGLNLVSTVGTAGINPIVAPETLDDYELGIKTNLFDNRLSFNANLFLENDANYQATSYTIINGTLQQFIGNVGKVQSRGAEIDARALLYEGLTAQLAATYDDGVYVSYPKAQCPYLYSYISTCNLSGAPLSGVSRLTFFGGAEYQHPIGKTDALALGFFKVNQQNIIGYFGGDATYRSSFLSALNDDPFSRVPAYTLFGLHLGAKTEDGALNFSLWVKNLTNKTYFQQIAVGTSAATGYGIATAILGDPRFYGMTLTAKF